MKAECNELLREKIYVSLPMSGKEETIWLRYQNAISEISEKFGDKYEVVAPENIEQFENSSDYERSHDWAWYMGKDLEHLLRCNAIFMTEGWEFSKGCRIELACAKEADIETLYSDEALGEIASKVAL